MKIIMSTTDNLWNVDMKCLRSHQKDVILLKFFSGGPDPDRDITVVDVRPAQMGLGNDSGRGRTSASYRILKEHLDDIMGRFKYQEDVIVLADSSPQHVYIFDILKGYTDKNNFNLHFFGVFPARFEGVRRKAIYEDLIAGVGRVKSLHLKRPDDYIKQVSRDITMKQFFEVIQEDLDDELPKLIKQICDFKESKNYFYSHYLKRYVDAERAHGEPHSFSNFDEVKGHIEQLEICENGKEMCNTLRAFRREFAEENHIPFESDDCDIDGPCAGTCQKCDGELTYLYGQLKLLNKEQVSYPYREISSGKENMEGVCTIAIPGGAFSWKSRTVGNTGGIADE